MKHPRGAPYLPQTRGKIGRWHQTLRNRFLLENYFLPGDLETQAEAFVDRYNYQRYHKNLKNVTPADVYFGRDKARQQRRERIKQKSLEARRLHHRQHDALSNQSDEPNSLLFEAVFGSKNSADVHATTSAVGGRSIIKTPA